MRIPVLSRIPRPSWKTALLLTLAGVAIWATLPTSLKAGRNLSAVLLEKTKGMDWSEHRSELPSSQVPTRDISPKLPPPPGTPSPSLITHPEVFASPLSQAPGAMLIRTGHLRLEVARYSEAYQGLQRILSEMGGYITDIQSSRLPSGRTRGTLTVRVPPERTFQTLDALRTLGTVTAEQVRTQDVTGDYGDLEVQLRTLREQASQVREILRSTSHDIKGRLEAQRQLAEIAQELAALEAQKRGTRQASRLSTITVDLHEPSEAKAATPGPFAPVGRALGEAGATLVQAVATLTYLGMVLAPWTLLLWLGWRMVGHRRITQATEGR